MLYECQNKLDLVYTISLFLLYKVSKQHAEVAAEEAAVAQIRERLEKVWGGPRPPPGKGRVEEAPWMVTEGTRVVKEGVEVFGGPRPPQGIGADKGVQGRQLIEELD